jgi:hypothetical protein
MQVGQSFGRVIEADSVGADLGGAVVDVHPAYW